MEKIFQRVSFFSTSLVLVILIGIFITLFNAAKPVIKEFEVGFIIDSRWNQEIQTDSISTDKNQAFIDKDRKLYKESGKVYGHRNIQKDLKNLGIHVNRKRVAKLYGVETYKHKPRGKACPLHKAHSNYLQQYFIVHKPNDSWMSVITYIRT